MSQRRGPCTAATSSSRFLRYEPVASSTLIGYARCSTDEQDLIGQSERPLSRRLTARRSDTRRTGSDADVRERGPIARRSVSVCSLPKRLRLGRHLRSGQLVDAREAVALLSVRAVANPLLGGAERLRGLEA